MRKVLLPGWAHLFPREVAGVFGVTTATVRAWERDGLITSVRSPGGGKRFCVAEVNAVLSGERKPRRAEAA